MSSTDSIHRLCEKYHTAYSTGSLAPTVCALAGLPAPARSSAPVIPEVLHLAEERFRMRSPALERIVVFCPDAIGTLLAQKYEADFAALRAETDYRSSGTTVMPSVTPVCFGTIFTGASPETHGIQQYEKPVIAIETIFDVFANAGKNVAICAVNECSIDRIFRKRNIQYFSLRSDEEARLTGIRLIQDNIYDLLVVYDGSYDSSLHRTGAFSPESLAAMRGSIRGFLEIAAALDASRGTRRSALVFAPDHGGHDVEDGRGTHGTDTPEDMLVSHYYRLR